MSGNYKGSSADSQMSSLKESRKRQHAHESLSSYSERSYKRRRAKIEGVGDTPKTTLVVSYEPPDAEDTTLYTRLREIDSSDYFKSQFRHAKQVLSALGNSASDLFWRHWVESSTSLPADFAENSTCFAMHRLIESWTFDMPNLFSSYSASNVSPQLSKFVQILQSCEPHAGDFRGIIVVKHRVVAIMMAVILRFVDETTDSIRPIAITTSDALQDGPSSDVLAKFAAGEFNLMVVTNKLKKLTVIQPSVLVWYNLFDETYSPFEFQGRFEEQQTHLIYMAERDNKDHKRILLSRKVDPLQQEDLSSVLGRHERDPHASDSTTDSQEDDDDDDIRSLQDPTTGRRLRPQCAKDTVLCLISAYQNDKHVAVDDIMHLDRTHLGQYVCQVRLPKAFLADTITGPPKPSPTSAEREACFLACNILFERGLLDYKSFPDRRTDELYENTVHAPGAIAPSAVAASGMRRYDRASPLFWTNSLLAKTQRLYPLLITIQGKLENSDHAPMLLLTRLPLPELFDFSVFSEGDKASVHCVHCAPFNVDEAMLELMHLYTSRISRTITNKELCFSADQLPYFFAPVKYPFATEEDGQMDKWTRPDVLSRIQWDSMRSAAEDFIKPLVSEDTSLDRACVDIVIQDRWVEFTNRYYFVNVRYDLTPLSKPPGHEHEANAVSFLDYCKARRKNFEGLKDETQPMIEVSPIPPLGDYLNPIVKPRRTGQRPSLKHLIPELCCKSTIPASTFRTALLLPSIVHRISDMLIAKQLNDAFFDSEIAEEHIFEALFPPSADTESSYERLELLGDAYLKYISSVYLYATLPTQHENALHTARGEIVSNRVLHLGGLSTGLPVFIRAKPFLPKVWQPTLLPQPPSTTLQGKQTHASALSDIAAKKGKRQKQQDEQSMQWIGDKTVADVVEALIGAAYLSKGRDLALYVSRRLQVPLPEVERWSDFKRKYSIQDDKARLQLLPSTVKAVEKIVGFKFRQPALLAEALTHSSLQHAQQTIGYDKLEFIGDAILDFFVIKHVYNRYPQVSSGGLSMLKSAMVLNTTLATICVLSGLYEHIQYMSHDLKLSINVFADKVKTFHAREIRRAKTEGRQPGQFWLELVAPKVLSDVVESVLGALFISEEFSEAGTDAFFHQVLRPFFEQHIRMQSLSHHPNIALYEWFQAEGCQEHQIMKTFENDQTRCDVVVHDTILASASDPIPTMARRRAASYALDALEGEPQFMSRICNCRANRIKQKLQKRQLGYEDDENAEVAKQMVGERREQSSDRIRI